MKLLPMANKALSWAPPPLSLTSHQPSAARQAHPAPSSHPCWGALPPSELHAVASPPAGVWSDVTRTAGLPDRQLK